MPNRPKFDRAARVEGIQRRIGTLREKHKDKKRRAITRGVIFVLLLPVIALLVVAAIALRAPELLEIPLRLFGFGAKQATEASTEASQIGYELQATREEAAELGLESSGLAIADEADEDGALSMASEGGELSGVEVAEESVESEG